MIERREIEQTINELWEMYDEAQSSGDEQSAQDYATKAFQLLANLPENRVYLSTKQ